MEKKSGNKTDNKKNFLWLLLSAAISLVVWQLPYGNYAMYPFTILSTWFHEMGHGISALLLGGSFKKLEIFSDGSGLATHTSTMLGTIGDAMTAAGGLMGPAIAGSLFIMSGRTEKWSKISLYALGFMLALSGLVWVRTLFGIGFVAIMSIVMFFTAAKATPSVRQFIIQFLGVQACISAYRQKDYLFMEKAVVGGQEHLSDTGAIADALLLPYWFWGGFIALLSAFLLYKALAYAFREQS